MLFRRHKKISAETLIGLKHYIDRFFPAEEAAADECAAAEPIAYRSAVREEPRMRGGFAKTAASRPAPCADSLGDALEQLDESFSQTLLRKIDERQMTDAQCYKKAQIDRKLFSKIRNQKDYRPSKATVLSFALALELNLAETRDLLMKAGYALSHSSKADIIVEFFILHGIYDKFQVNEALYEFDQPLL